MSEYIPTVYLSSNIFQTPFILPQHIEGKEVDGGVLVATLNLVDLAGSESSRHTGAEGQRQREASNINRSLLTLSRVINSLAQNSVHL